MTRTKSAQVEIKSEDQGLVSAVFATFDVIDADQDVTRKGAFGEQDVVISAYGHTSWLGAVPVGRGKTRETSEGVIMDGEFFIDTATGKDTFAVVKRLGDLQEWSYGFDITKESYGEHDGQKVRFLEGLSVHEVSPVLKGAGVGTRLLSAKGARFADHIDVVVTAVDGLINRAADVVALRAEKGKGLGGASADKLRSLDESLERLKSLLAGEEDHVTEVDAVSDIAREFARYVAITNGVVE